MCSSDLVVVNKADGSFYTIKKNAGKVHEVEYKAPKNKKQTKIAVPDSIKINGATYKVTSIAKSAFKNNKKLKTVTIGKNVSKIGENVFSGCKKLKTITIKSTKLKAKTLSKSTFKAPPLMRSENGFCHGTGLEQAETEQNSVAYNAPNGVDGVPGNCHALDQHGINCHADEDEKALKAQCEQAFQVVLPHVRLLVVAEGRHGDGRKAHHAVDFNHTPVDDDKNDDAQYPHGDADEETLQEQPEQRSYIHLHQAGFQHRQANIVDTGVSGNDAAGIGHNFLRKVKDCHHNIKSIADEPHRNSGLKNPAHDEGRLKLRHVVVLGDHLDQLVAGNKGQDDACDGQHHVPG